jgi:hypothetical protein
MRQTAAVQASRFLQLACGTRNHVASLSSSSGAHIHEADVRGYRRRRGDNTP